MNEGRKEGKKKGKDSLWSSVVRSVRDVASLAFHRRQHTNSAPTRHPATKLPLHKRGNPTIKRAIVKGTLDFDSAVERLEEQMDWHALMIGVRVVDHYRNLIEYRYR